MPTAARLTATHMRMLTPRASITQVFKLNPLRAWGAVLTSIVAMAASLYLISISPWYLLPFAWALSGTAFTGVSSKHPNNNPHAHLPPCLPPSEVTMMVYPVPVPCTLQWFVVGHDCGHRSFSENQLLEDIVGTIMFAPLIFPFEPWRIKHNHHHAHTNK